MDVLVSACIITYNQVNYIRDCIEGALMQEVDFGYEIVIADDCSTDGTSEICADYAAKFPNLIKHFRRDKNLGPNRNVLKAYGECKGKYIAVCEGDDYWSNSNKIYLQFRLLSNNTKYAGSFHNTIIINEEGKQQERIYGANQKTELSSKDVLSKVAPFHTSSFMFKREAIKYPSWIYNVVSLDIAIFSIISQQGLLVKVERNMSVYRKHKGGSTSSEDVVRNYHKDRIRLLGYLNKFHRYRYNRKIYQVICYHFGASSDLGFIRRVYYRVNFLFNEAKRIAYGAF